MCGTRIALVVDLAITDRVADAGRDANTLTFSA
jgi:hypothetical protein